MGAIAAEDAVSKYNDGKDPRFDSVKASIRRGEAGFKIGYSSYSPPKITGSVLSCFQNQAGIP